MHLSQVVGLKRLAPYRDDGGLGRPNYGKLHELRASQGAKKPATKQSKAARVLGNSLFRQQEDAGSTDPAHQDLEYAEPHLGAADHEDAGAAYGQAEQDEYANMDNHELPQIRHSEGQQQAAQVLQTGVKKKRKRTAGAYGKQGGSSSAAEPAVTAHVHANGTAHSTAAAGIRTNEQRPTNQRRKRREGSSPAHAEMPSAEVSTQSGVPGHGKKAEAGAAQAHAQSAADAAWQHRLSTYQQPALQRGAAAPAPASKHPHKGSSKAGKASDVSMQASAGNAEAALSKAQKRNARRARLRFEKQGQHAQS